MPTPHSSPRPLTRGDYLAFCAGLLIALLNLAIVAVLVIRGVGRAMP